IKMIDMDREAIHFSIHSIGQIFFVRLDRKRNNYNRKYIIIAAATRAIYTRPINSLNPFNSDPLILFAS
ncbi:hypothetical protein, partial [Fulvivirga sp.]|uniref:hypothetical protein n=1 Tax=Fulvivirga sp. TaxID=1931237 RepID=UPI0032EC6D69